MNIYKIKLDNKDEYVERHTKEKHKVGDKVLVGWCKIPGKIIKVIKEV